MTEESFIDFKCPHCGNPVSFPQEAAGFVQECPNCTENVIVPKDGGDVGGALPFPIATPRFVLRRLAVDDWEDLLAFLADEELFPYQPGRVFDEEEILRWLDSDRHLRLTTPNAAFCLGIESSAHDKVIGYLTFTFSDPQRLQAEVSAVLGRAYQRQGFAAEALAVLLSFCFDGISLHRVVARCDSRHVAACRLFEKLGLRREGEFVEDHQVNGEWASTVLLAVLSREYRDSGSAPSGGDAG